MENELEDLFKGSKETFNTSEGIEVVKTSNGGTEIKLRGDQVATAIDAYLVSHNIYVSGPRTITVNNERCRHGEIYVDPSGFVIKNGNKV